MAAIFMGPRQITGVLMSGRRKAMDMAERFPVIFTGSIRFPMAWSRWS